MIENTLHYRSPKMELYYSLKKPQKAEQFYRLGKGIASDLWVTRWSDMKKMKLPIPTLSEQERISEYLTHKTTEIDNVITNIESMREKIGKYRCDLISAAVTGKVAVE